MEDNLLAGSKDKIVLCAANSYKKKYYINPDFSSLPQSIRDELKALCIGFTEGLGGIISLDFDISGNLNINVAVADEDIYFDEIESGMRISHIQRQYEDLLEELEVYYRIFIEKNR